MRIQVGASADDLARRAADMLGAIVRGKPDAVLGLATGKTPLGLYAELSRRVAAGDIDLRGVVAFAIDELHGVPRDHPATNASYFARELSVPLAALHIMDSEAPDPQAECDRVRELIERAGGLDLVMLGIGRNGHLAFNEPGSPFDSRARRVTLAQSTREQYVPYFGSLEQTPAFGLTLGLSDLLAARKALLLATGADKAEIVAHALEGPVSEQVPASALQRHPDATVLLDPAAAARLRHVTS
jgi:glucosamine-6-phosphate deaminase